MSSLELTTPPPPSISFPTWVGVGVFGLVHKLLELLAQLSAVLTPLVWLAREHMSNQHVSRFLAKKFKKRARAHRIFRSSYLGNTWSRLTAVLIGLLLLLNSAVALDRAMGSGVCYS